MSFSSTVTRRLSIAAAVAGVAATLALPATASAQMRLEPVRVTAARWAEANALTEKAVSLYSTPKKYKYAASLHMRAANLRAPGDSAGFMDLSMAGHLYRAAGDLLSARAAMERAAEHAAARGDVYNAAKAYVDAGFLAIEEHRSDRVPALALKAELLAKSPLLSDEQRASIMGRVGYSQVVATIQR
jgi:hypothetical protein